MARRPGCGVERGDQGVGHGDERLPSRFNTTALTEVFGSTGPCQTTAGLMASCTTR